MVQNFKRLPTAPFSHLLIYRLIVFLIVTLLLGIVAYLYHYNPLELAAFILKTNTQTYFGWEGIILYATPLLLTGASCFLSFKLKIINNGAEGQFLIGALTSTWAGLGLHNTTMPTSLSLIIILFSGIVGGCFWIIVPALAKIFANVNEILTTLMMNYIAFYLILYCVTGPIQGKYGSSPIIPFHLPYLWGNIHIGILISLICVFLLYFCLAFTRWGYELLICGSSPKTAHYLGLPLKRYVFFIMLISGGLAGLAGSLETIGTVHCLQPNISSGLGYLGIIVSILAHHSPLSLIPSAFFIGSILNTGIIMQTQQVNNSIITAITGLMLLLIAIADELAHYQFVKPLRKKKEV